MWDMGQGRGRRTGGGGDGTRDIQSLGDDKVCPGGMLLRGG